MQCDTVWLARHGVRWEPVPAPYPFYDCPISELGEQQAEALAERLAETPIDFIFCSPFRRTIQTIRPLAQRLGLPIKLEWGLAEVFSTGCFKVSPILPSIAERHQEFPEVDLNYQSLVMPIYPESEEQHWQRIANTLDQLVQNYGPTLFLMSHGSPTQGIRRHLLQRQEPFNMDYCCVSKLVRDGNSWTYELDTCNQHLASRNIYVPNFD